MIWVGSDGLLGFGGMESFFFFFFQLKEQIPKNICGLCERTQVS